MASLLAAGLLPRSCVPVRALLLLSPRLVPNVLVAPSCSASVVPQGCPSRAVLRLLLTARSPPTAAPAPRPLLLALSSPGARPARASAPSVPRAAAADPSASAAWFASRSSGAAEARRRNRDKHRRRTRRHSKRSIYWRLTGAPSAHERLASVRQRDVRPRGSC